MATTTISTFNYVKECPKDLECSICHDALIDPVVEPNCGHMFCRECMQKWINNKSGTCPQCRSKIVERSLSIAPIYVKNIVNSLMVICPNCKQSFERQQLSTHLQLCPVPCTYYCGKSIPPKNKKQHEDECPMKPIACPAASVGCKYSDIREKVDEHKKKCSRCELFSELKELKAASGKIAQLAEIVKNLVEIEKEGNVWNNKYDARKYINKVNLE